MVIFKDIPVSTQTFTVKTNMFFTVDFEQLFNKMNLDEFIISIKYKTQIKGEFKKKKTKKKTNSKKNFLNCITVVVLFDKKINVKVFKNGVFQLTGCKNLHHAKQSIYYILQHISKCVNDSCVVEGDDSGDSGCLSDVICYFKSAMRNIDFELGYKINREILAQQLDLNTNINIPPIICTNMGVKIKLPINLKTLPVYKMYFKDYPSHTEIEYIDCFDYLFGKKILDEDRDQKMNKFVSVSIFQNGKVTFSCADMIYQEQYFNWFMDIMKNIKPLIIKKDVEKKSFYT